jgi:hypothetical protein
MRRVVFLVAIIVALMNAAVGFAADVTTPFAGKAVTGGTVTHELRGGKHVLTVCPTSPCPARPTLTGRSSTPRGRSISSTA